MTFVRPKTLFEVSQRTLTRQHDFDRAESPTAFRRRLPFVSADALDRASMPRS